MRIAPAELDLDRFDLVVDPDPDAEPIDLVEVLLDFVDRIVERRLSKGNRSSSAADLAGGLDVTNSEAQQR